MTAKKTSLTKQIGEVLQTENKKEQLERIQGLLQDNQSPVVAVTVLFAKGQTLTNVSSPFNVTADQVKFVLSAAIDEITPKIVRAELEQEQQVGPQTGDVMANGDMTP